MSLPGPLSLSTALAQAALQRNLNRTSVQSGIGLRFPRAAADIVRDSHAGSTVVVFVIRHLVVPAIKRLPGVFLLLWNANEDGVQIG